MNKKRKEVEELILKYIAKIVTGDENLTLYKNMFKSMSDKDFDEFMHKLKNDETRLQIIVPTGSNSIKVSVKNNLKIAKELGFDFFQKLTYYKDNKEKSHTSPVKRLVYRLPIRRVTQSLSKKISISENNISRDNLTGQVTSKDKSAMLTYPELQVLTGLGLEDSIKELIKIRGGDLNAESALMSDLVKYGKTNQSSINERSSGVTSTNTLKNYFLSMGIKSTL